MDENSKSSPARPTLDYIRPLEVEPGSKRYLRAAKTCGITSITAWIGVVGCWLIFAHPILLILMFFTIIAELVLFVVGLVWLMAFFEDVPHGPKRFSRFLSASWPALVALFINFPVTALTVWSFYFFK